uniref:Uncharacterized protein n=1 Tax=Ochrobactrum phage ORM_20 TaxID=2985243 RepID=A0A9N6ZHL8_9VIRU|nr:hypothetical protein ORM20_00049 [Ochrobactrum phage ORM_20]
MDEPEPVIAWSCYRIDCPCGYVMYFEDVDKDETYTCEDCGTLVSVESIY